MTLTYLYQAKSNTIDSTGGCVVGPFRPDTGQYWLPTVVHVGIRTQNLLTTGLVNPNTITDNVQCELRSGSIAALATDITTTKDRTYFGSNDTSTILSGTVVSPGEGISCIFSGGNVLGDVVYAEIHGISSDTPPTIDIIPNIPGARFAGSAKDFDIVTTFQTVSPDVAAGGDVFSLTFDMRNLQSYNLNIEVQEHAAPPTEFVPIYITIEWWDQTFPAHIIYSEVYQIFAANAGVPFTTGDFGKFMINDSCHGPYMRYRIRNGGAADVVQVKHQMLGSSSFQLGRSYVLNTPINVTAQPPNFWDGVFPPFNLNVAAGATQSVFWPMQHGKGTFSIQTSNGPHEVDFFDPAGNRFMSFTIAAGNNVTFEATWPRTAIRVAVTNNGGVLGTSNFQGVSYSDVY